MDDIKIKYDKLGIIVVTGLLSIISWFLYRVVSDHEVNAIQIMIPSLIIFLCWYNWIEFLIPFFLGKPAIVISKEGLFISSIGVLIEWQDISKLKITQVKYGHIIKIFAREQENKVKLFKSPFRWLLSLMDDFTHNTPFTFNTMFIQGKANDTYHLIRSKCRNLDPILSPSHRNLLAKQNRK